MMCMLRILTTSALSFGSDMQLWKNDVHVANTNNLCIEFRQWYAVVKKNDVHVNCRPALDTNYTLQGFACLVVVLFSLS